MQFSSFVLTALALAVGSQASLVHPVHHPAGHLFSRSSMERRTPVELYSGEDPQLVGRASAPEIVYDSTVKRSCSHNIADFAPRHLKDENGALLQKRQAPTNSPGTGTPYPSPGSDPPAANTLPKAWVDRYNQMKAAGVIPNIPVAGTSASGGPAYPAGTDMSKVCSWTLQKCNDGDIYLAPDNNVAFGIDDGPTPDGTPAYLDTLTQNNISATHFLIGSAIYWNMPTMKLLADATPHQHLAIHTWSHTLQTTKTDLQVLGDLGWTMQIIYDVSGKVPMYVRFPEGDVDARTRAIAKYVFGMQSVMWTVDADDWCLRQGNGTAALQTCRQNAPNFKTVSDAEVAWASPKTNNSGYITLNHETTDQASRAFANMLRAAKRENWNIVGNVADLQALPWYNNQYGPLDTATQPSNILPTKDIINVTDSTAAKGSSAAPKLGNWAKVAATQNPAAAAQTSGTNNSGSSNRISTSSNKSSGAVTVRFATGTAAIGLLISAMALLL